MSSSGLTAYTTCSPSSSPFPSFPSSSSVHTLQVPKKPIVFLVTDKIATSSLYKALSTDFHKTFTFYTVKDDPEFDPIKKNFGITKTPSLILWRGEDQVEIYGGTLKLGHISHWLRQASKSKSKASNGTKSQKKEAEEERGQKQQQQKQAKTTAEAAAQQKESVKVEL